MPLASEFPARLRQLSIVDYSFSTGVDAVEDEGHLVFVKVEAEACQCEAKVLAIDHPHAIAVELEKGVGQRGSRL